MISNCGPCRRYAMATLPSTSTSETSTSLLFQAIVAGTAGCSVGPCSVGSALFVVQEKRSKPRTSIPTIVSLVPMDHINTPWFETMAFPYPLEQGLVPESKRSILALATLSTISLHKRHSTSKRKMCGIWMCSLSGGANRQILARQ